MTTWISQSNPSKQALYAGVSALLGFALVVAVLASGVRGGNAIAGGLLGASLLVLGVAAFLYIGKQTVTVDPRGHRIVVEDSQILGAKSRSIAFGDVERVSIGYIGKKSNLVGVYYLVLVLRSGEEYPLFAPGRGYDGATSRATVEAWRDRLDEYLRAA